MPGGADVESSMEQALVMLKGMFLPAKSVTATFFILISVAFTPIK